MCNDPKDKHSDKSGMHSLCWMIADRASWMTDNKKQAILWRDERRIDPKSNRGTIVCDIYKIQADGRGERERK